MPITASALSGIDPGLLDESDPPQESKLMEKTAGWTRLGKNAIAFFPLSHSFGCCRPDWFRTACIDVGGQFQSEHIQWALEDLARANNFKSCFRCGSF